MIKRVILITIVGALCASSGAATAQANGMGRGPIAGVGAVASNGLLIAVPTVGAFNRPVDIPMASVAVLAGHAHAAPGLADKTPAGGKSPKDSGALQVAQEASKSVDLERQRLQRLPTCE